MSEDFPLIPPPMPRYYEIPEHIPPRQPGTEYPMLHLNSHIFEPLVPVPTSYLPMIPFIIYWEEQPDRVLRHLLDTELVCQCWFHNQPEANHYVYRVRVVGVAVLNRFKSATILVVRLQTIPDPRSDGGRDFADPPIIGEAGHVMGRSMLRNAYEAMAQRDAIHQRYPGGWDFNRDVPIDYCYVCGQLWPCETARAKGV